MKKILTLNDNLTIPILGFGTWELLGAKAKMAVLTALEVGYRHVDTADAYENHKEVGLAIKESRVPREELFITSKLWRDEFEKGKVKGACQRALKELGLDYLDLYLLHWPNKDVPIGETLEAMRELVEVGLVRSIGVSNFTIHHLEDVIATGISVALNQVEFHPSLYQKELEEFCGKHAIAVTAYSPMARGADLKIPTIVDIAKKYKKSASQIILNWTMQKGIVVIPKASNPIHIRDNFASLEFDLAPEDCALIDNLHMNRRIVLPDFNEFDY
ncbi:MAG: aldo/keto reductase [Candidatus Taylorbacteria bacterium]